MKFSYLLCTLCTLLSYITLNAQVGVNNTNPKAMLDITAENAGTPSNTDGILIPRLDALPITNPTVDQNGMLIFLTTSSNGFQPGFLYWDNNIPDWVAINTGANTSDGWKLDGNAIENGDFFGTTNNKSVKIYTNNTQQFSFTPDGQLAFNEGIEIGDGSTETNGNIAIGVTRLFWGPIKAEYDNSIAIGTSSQSLGVSSVSLGARAIASGVSAVCIGPQSKAGSKASAFGPESEATGRYATANGNNAKASGESSLALGDQSTASANKALAFGFEANASGSSALAFGQTAEASSSAATAIGSASKATGQSAIAIGYSEALGENSIAIGGQGSIGPGLTGKTTASLNHSIAIGTGAEASTVDATAIGRGAKATQTDATAIGRFASASEVSAVAIGTSAEASAENATAIGNGAQSDTANEIVLGNNAITNVRTSGIMNADSFIATNSGTTYADYVFEKYFSGFSKIKPEYNFKTIEETEAFVKKHGHLPNVASYKKIKENDFKINLTETSITNLEKIEEHFLYLVELNSKVENLNKAIVKKTIENKTLLKRLDELQRQIDELKKMKQEFDALKKAILKVQSTSKK